MDSDSESEKEEGQPCNARAVPDLGEGSEECSICHVLAEVSDEDVVVFAGVFSLTALERPVQSHFSAVYHFSCECL